MQFDFEALRALIRDKLRSVYREVVANEATGGLYAVFIRTVDTGEILTATCNSEANLRDQYGDDPPAPDDEFKFPEYCNERWNDAEWLEELIDCNDGSLQLHDTLEEFCAEFADDAEGFGGAAYAAIILALGDLDEEGLFGSGSVRESVTLYCGSVDGDPGWLHVESARRLNSAANAARFAKEWELALGLEPEEPSGDQYDSFLRWIDDDIDDYHED
jgi:hypothetical protein